MAPSEENYTVDLGSWGEMNFEVIRDGLGDPHPDRPWKNYRMGVVVDLSIDSAFSCTNFTIEGDDGSPVASWNLFQISVQVSGAEMAVVRATKAWDYLEWVFDQDNIDLRLDQLGSWTLLDIVEWGWGKVQREEVI